MVDSKRTDMSSPVEKADLDSRENGADVYDIFNQEMVHRTK